MKLLPLIAMVALLAAACGTPRTEEPAAPGPGNPADALFAQNCGPCHASGQAPRIASVADARRTRAAAEISSGAMPPGKRLSPDVKQQMLNALGGAQ
jgi:hypothetical protein